MASPPRLPATVDYRINSMSGYTVDELESGMTNAVVENYGTQRQVYATQRPSITVTELAAASVTDARGRAVYHWTEGDAIYMVNNTDLYKGNYGTSISSAITAGTNPCTFLELDDKLVLLDSTGDKGWQIETDDTVTEITDTNFPPKDTPAVSLAYGGAVLNGYLFVLGTNGTVYNSDNGSVTSWTGTSFITAERDYDGGQYLGKHHDHIAVLGTKTIEFFYDAGNATGSPLARRQDIMYNVGCADGAAVWQDGDTIYFIGVDNTGAYAAYVLDNFRLEKVENSTINAFFTQAGITQGAGMVGAGLSAFGHKYFIVTVHTTPDDILPAISLCYDLTTKLWSEWSTLSGAGLAFPLMSWTLRSGASEGRAGEGIMSNGDLVRIRADMFPIDVTGTDPYFVPGYYVDDDYYNNLDGRTDNIEFKVRFGQEDMGISNYKFCHSVLPVATKTPSSQTVTIKWSDEDNQSFTTGRTLDSSTRSRVRRAGEYARRNYELLYSGSEAYRLEGLEQELTLGRK